MPATTTDTRPLFSKGSVIAWGRSIGIPDATALDFMRQEGVIIIDDGTPIILQGSQPGRADVRS
jgi:hypothetical protein